MCEIITFSLCRCFSAAFQSKTMQSNCSLKPTLRFHFSNISIWQYNVFFVKTHFILFKNCITHWFQQTHQELILIQAMHWLLVYQTAAL